MMKNGVTFGDKHSINDWDLLMISKNIGEAEPRTNYVEIKGRDGSLDLTESLGEVKYNDRVLTFNFDLFNPSNYWEIKQKISNYLNGRKMKIILDQDPMYYYYGRCVVKNATNQKNLGQFEIVCVCDPYKMKNDETFVSKSINTNDKFILTNQRKKVIPVIVSENNIVLKFNDKQFSIASGISYQSPDFTLSYGSNEVEVLSGSGNVSFSYREGSL